MGLSLYVTWYFSLANFNIYSFLKLVFSLLYPVEWFSFVLVCFKS
jgi:hypothetical protein